MSTGIVLGQTMDTGIVLHRWTLTMNTMTLSSTGQYWTATPGFADVVCIQENRPLVAFDLHFAVAEFGLRSLTHEII